MRRVPVPVPSEHTGQLHLQPIAMAFLLDGWFKTDDDDINDLPPDFRDIYVNPWKVRPPRQAHEPRIVPYFVNVSRLFSAQLV